MNLKYFNIFCVYCVKVFSHILFPKKCMICQNKNYFFNKKVLCYICEKNLKRPKDVSDLPDWIYYKYCYKDHNVQKIEYMMKYFHNKDLCITMGSYVSDFFNFSLIQRFESLNQNYILLPVPISKNRRKERGYNQAKEIAVGIDKSKVFEIIKRNKNTQKLFELDQAQRSELLFDVFEVDSVEINILKNTFANINIKDLNIVIIDDITTTGTTFYNIRKILLDNGFLEERIFGFALAH